ncbi:hypothetical protein [Runella sp. SP2]|uniref:hypothetical protein n=1 Tax=Runella sp. SP2 TaxID=2268026 RepID=UPI000F092B5D|nr:hypothetical protein [Runella sp. SP2]AYQ34176.1 hypothetical protein DTQ70_19340 [Runella sp. SP2]
MKRKSTYVYALIFFVLGINAICQDRMPVFIGEKNNPTEYFSAYVAKRRLELLEKADHLDTLCLESICYVKFKVDATGKVFNTDCTVTAPKLISNFLKEMVKSSDSLWKPQLREGKPVESISFLLPVYYKVYSKCKERFKPQVKTLEGFWHIHWFNGDIQYDSTLRGASYQTDLIEPYLVMHPIQVYIGKPIYSN